MAAAKKTTAKTTVDAPEVEQMIPEPIIEVVPVPSHQRWEYGAVRVANFESWYDKLNEAGMDGWEVINVDTYQGVAWLKRPVL